jgi:hypothetical protein
LRSFFAFVLMVSVALSATGCVAAAIVGGVAGGYVVAKHLDEDKQLREKKDEGVKGWFSKLGKEQES